MYGLELFATIGFVIYGIFMLIGYFTSESENRNSGNGSSNNTNPNQAPSYNQSKNSSNSNSSSNSKPNMSDPFADNSKPMDISDSDLPF